MSEIEQRIAEHLPAARRGDREAFAELVAATQTVTTSLALAVVRDVQYSEDIAQEAYVRVWQRLDRLGNPDSFLPWLRQITRNLARDHLRRKRVRPGDTSDGIDAETALDLSGPNHASAEDSAERAERDRAIDPEAARRQLRHKRLAWMGMIGGALCGGAGLIAGLASAGRIGFGG